MMEYIGDKGKKAFFLQRDQNERSISSKGHPIFSTPKLHPEALVFKSSLWMNVKTHSKTKGYHIYEFDHNENRVAPCHFLHQESKIKSSNVHLR